MISQGVGGHRVDVGIRHLASMTGSQSGDLQSYWRCGTYHVLWARFRDWNVHLRWLGCHYLCRANTIRKDHLTAISLVDWNSWNTSIDLHNTTICQSNIHVTERVIKQVTDPCQRVFFLVQQSTKCMSSFTILVFITVNYPSILVKLRLLLENCNKFSTNCRQENVSNGKNLH